MKPTRQEIQDYILSTLGDLCRDWDYSQPLSASSLLFTELGLESLDAVVLCTNIQEHYGQPLPFAELLAEIGRVQRDLSIGELAEFVEKNLKQVGSESAAAVRLQ